MSFAFVSLAKDSIDATDPKKVSVLTPFHEVTLFYVAKKNLLKK